MVRIVASAEVPVPPERASELILNPRVMEQWLIGAKGMKADKSWPFFNTSLSWETGQGAEFCEARVLDNHLPEFLKVDVTTPTHSRVVTHKFTALPNGRTLYERVVEAEFSGFQKLFGAGRLKSQIEKEVRRAASLVKEAPAAAKKTTMKPA
ncbi:MAG: SRPBCC family protein [Euryarchaeota archaeon]|nr:SRPBCC family protein [Euryarchaeota archaeon]